MRLYVLTLTLSVLTPCVWIFCLSGSSNNFKFGIKKTPASPACSVGSVRGTQDSSFPLCWDLLPRE